MHSYKRMRNTVGTFSFNTARPAGALSQLSRDPLRETSLQAFRRVATPPGRGEPEQTNAGDGDGFEESRRTRPAATRNAFLPLRLPSGRGAPRFLQQPSENSRGLAISPPRPSGDPALVRKTRNVVELIEISIAPAPR